jgi:transposase
MVMLGGIAMADLLLLSEAQMRRIEPYFPLSHGIARVDDRRVISGIIFVIRNGLRWRDAPPDYGPHKTIYNRFVRWSRLGVFNKIFAELARKAGKPSRLMIDALPPAKQLLADKGYDADWFRRALAERGIMACIPSKSNRKKPIEHDRELYRQRHKIENMFGRLKDWRRIHTRYDRCAHTFMSAICIAAAVIFWP